MLSFLTTALLPMPLLIMPLLPPLPTAAITMPAGDGVAADVAGSSTEVPLAIAVVAVVKEPKANQVEIMSKECMAWHE